MGRRSRNRAKRDQANENHGRGLDEVIVEALIATRDGDARGVTSSLDHLVQQDEGRVDAALERHLEPAVSDVWTRGWQPADVPRFLRRQGVIHARVAAEAIVAEAARYHPTGLDARWRDQLDELRDAVATSGRTRDGVDRIEHLATVVETLVMLLGLGPLPVLCSLPGHAAGAVPRVGVDGRMLQRVRALLAKAESTTFPEEAEALTAKAQELMARHALDRAVLDAAEGNESEPAAWRIGVDDPYAGAKSMLVDQVARANRCRAVWSKGLGFSTVFGHENDLAAVELLYTSLLVQATVAVAAASAGRPRVRSFRQSFLTAYAARIGARLEEATVATEHEAASTHGAALVPVLADRHHAADDACTTTFPNVATHSISANDLAGWKAGTAAADLASLRADPEVSSGRARSAQAAHH